LHPTNKRQSYLTCTLGPTATVLLHRLTSAPLWTVGEWPVEALSWSFGIPVNQLARSLSRLSIFGMAWPATDHDGCEVCRIPATTDLTPRQFDKMPTYLQQWYREQFPNGQAIAGVSAA